jgi:hypothetical protein
MNILDMKRKLLPLSGYMGGGGDSGGGGGPQTSTSYNTNIPEYARPYVETMLGSAQQELFNYEPSEAKYEDVPIYQETPGYRGMPGTKTQIGTERKLVPGSGEMVPKGLKAYKPFNEDPSKYFAGPSDLQTGARLAAQNMGVTPETGQAAYMANAAGLGGLRSAQDAMRYGEQGQQSGLMGQGLGIQGGQLGITGGQRYGEMGVGYGAQGAGYGAQGAGLAGTALGYGQESSDIGRMGLRAEQYGRQVSGQAEDYARQAAGAGAQYARMAIDPRVTQALMNPYTQNVLDVQNRELERQASIASTQRGAQAARSGAFGGSRQAIENAEANRNLAGMKTANTAQALNQAYQQAQQAQQFGANLNLQGLQGAQQGLGTALQGGQLGLSGIGTALQGQQGALSGVGAANQAYQTGIQGAQAGMQGAQTGLQGVNTQLSGVDRQLAGTAQGMQGAQVGLQGVSGAQAGYGLTNQAAGQLGQLGQNIYGQQVGNINLQNQLGGQQQQEQQAILNQQIQNYATAQQYPMMQLSNMSNLLRGMPMQSTTVQGYQAQPNALSQLGGLGLTAAGIAGLGKAKGGRIKEKKRPAGLAELALMKMR